MRDKASGIHASAVVVEHTDVVVVGSGLAGLTAALRLAPLSVLLLTKTDELPGGSSLWAQGGIAAALGPDDTPEDHAADTVTAGAGLSDPALALDLARDGAAAVRRLLNEGLVADRDADGRLALGREAAHGAHRILHAGGDATGRTLVAYLADRVRAAPHVRVETRTFAWDLVTAGGRVAGVLAHGGDRGWVLVRAGAVVLATGGVGRLWGRTTNPSEATGDGPALAVRAGARLRDLEFMQFHPTALGLPTAGRTPLLTEALRGAGALLLDGRGHRFMAAEHPDAELAPRDVVARAIGRRIAAGDTVALDLRALWRDGGAARFPTVDAICRAAGLDPAAAPIPVAPAAHYHMGGIAADLDGATSLPGLYAVGETACTGVHGANRLASNSLLEALVTAERAAARIRADGARPRPVPVPQIPTIRTPDETSAESVGRIMDAHVGLVRDGKGLEAARCALDDLVRRIATAPPADRDDSETVRRAGELRNRLLLARLLVRAALARTESRGAHCRADVPDADPAWRRHQTIGLDALETPTHPPHTALSLAEAD